MPQWTVMQNPRNSQIVQQIIFLMFLCTHLDPHNDIKESPTRDGFVLLLILHVVFIQQHAHRSMLRGECRRGNTYTYEECKLQKK